MTCEEFKKLPGKEKARIVFLNPVVAFALTLLLLLVVGASTKYYKMNEVCARFCEHSTCQAQCHMPSCVWHEDKARLKRFWHQHFS